MQVPLISVGILSGKEIEFSFPIKFISSDETESSGMQKAIYRDGKIHWQGKNIMNYLSLPNKVHLLSLN